MDHSHRRKTSSPTPVYVTLSLVLGSRPLTECCSPLHIAPLTLFVWEVNVGYIQQLRVKPELSDPQAGLYARLSSLPEMSHYTA